MEYLVYMDKKKKDHRHLAVPSSKTALCGAKISLDEAAALLAVWGYYGGNYTYCKRCSEIYRKEKKNDET